MASYLGMKIARNAAGLSDQETGLEGIICPTGPLYSGNPWLLAPAVVAYRVREGFGP